MEFSRPTREQIHISTAFLWASRSMDPRRKVGAVITTEDMKRILSIGYNGPAKGLPDSYIRDEPGNSGCLHAEDNAIAMVDSTIPDKIIFITDEPCEMCAQRIVNANITRVYYHHPYRAHTGLSVLDKCGVPFEQIDGVSISG